MGRNQNGHANGSNISGEVIKICVVDQVVVEGKAVVAEEAPMATLANRAKW